LSTGDRRVVELSDEMRDRVSSFLRHHNDIMIQFAVRQSSNSVGTILSFGNERNQ